ncbi:MAG: Ig-like domain-containing protein [Bacillota bacterium]
MGEKVSKSVCYLLLLTFASFILPQQVLANDAPSFPATLFLNDNTGQPISGAQIYLMRENDAAIVDTTTSDQDGKAVFHTKLKNISQHYYIYAILQQDNLPADFPVAPDQVIYLYVSPSIDWPRDFSQPVTLEINWKNYVYMMQEGKNNYDKLFIRSLDANPYYLFRFDLPPGVAIAYMFLPMKKSYQMIRSSDEKLANDFIIWWPFYAEPGASIHIY